MSRGARSRKPPPLSSTCLPTADGRKIDVDNMLILASTSSTRRNILTNAGISFEAIKPDVDETALIAANPGWSPLDTALRLAEAKAMSVSTLHPEAITIGADQVL